MPVHETAKYRILSNVVQTTLGKTSQVKYATHFVKANIVSDQVMHCMYTSTVNFGHQNVFLELRHKYVQEGIDVIQELLKKFQDEYAEAVKQKEELSGILQNPYEKPPAKKVKLKILQNTIRDNIEFISASIYDPRKTVLFRLFMEVEIS